MRVTEKMTSDNAIFNINRSQNRLNQLNEQLSSNQNINRPSDDPIGTRQILDMQSQVRSIDQYMSNIQNGQTWTAVANLALQGMNDFLAQAKSAASNILGGTNDSVSTLNALASLENVRQQIIDLANVQIGDQYIFGGFNNATPVVSNKTLSGVIDNSKSQNQITGISTTGLIVGMTVSGKGILPDTTITNIDSTNGIVTLSKNPISTGSGFDYTFGLPPTSQKGNVSLSASQYQITGIDTTGLIAGDPVTGPGVPLGAIIQSVDISHSTAGQITLDQPLTQAVTGGAFNFVPRIIQTAGNAVSGTPTITGIDTTGFHVGGAITGQGIPPGTTVTAFTGPGPGSTVTLSQSMTQAATGTTTFAFTPTLIQTGNADSDTVQLGYVDSATSGANVINIASNMTGVHLGGAVAGPGVPAGTVITGIVGSAVTVNNPLPDMTGISFTFTNPSLSYITGFDTTNLNVGDTVTGPGVPPVPPGVATTIAAIGPWPFSEITLSQPLTQTVSGGNFLFTPAANISVDTQSGNTSFSSSKITGLITNGLTAGMTISGPGVTSGTTILSVDSASQITLSQPLTQAVTNGTFTFVPTTSKTGGNTTALTNTITGLADTTSLSVGMLIAGPGVPDNTKITGIGPGTTLTLNNNATLTTAGGTFTFGPTVTKVGTTDPPNQITGLPLAQLQNLYIGMKVTGPGIPDNTTITDIDTTDINGTGSVTLSKIPTGPGGAGQFVFAGYIESYGERTMMGSVTNASSTINGLPSTSNMINSPAVSKTGSTNPSVNPNEITGLVDTNGLTVGMVITDNAGGTIIPPNTIVTEIDPVAKSITLSNPFIPPTTKTGVAGMTTAIDITAAGTIGGGVNIVTANGTSYTGVLGDAAGAALAVGATNAVLTINVNGVITTIGTYSSAAGTGNITDITYTNPVSVDVGGAPGGLATQPITFTSNPVFAAAMAAAGGTPPLPTAGTVPQNQITGIDTSNLFVGMKVTGPGIPANTTITGTPTSTPPSLAGTITLSNNTTVFAPVGTIFAFAPTTLSTATSASFNFSQPISKTAATTIANNQITGLADTNNLFVGMPVSDSSGVIPANTTITDINTTTNTITLSNNASATRSATKLFFTPTMPKTSQPISKTGDTDPVVNPNLITGLADTNSLFVGMPVSGPGIPANTTITETPLSNTLLAAGTVKLSNNTTAALAGTDFSFTPVVTGVNQIAVDTTNLFVGMPVTGPGIPANTTITDTPDSNPLLAAGTITLSNTPTMTSPAGLFYFGQYSSMTVSGAGVTPNPSIGVIVNSNSMNLSNAATAVTSPIGGTELTFTGHFAAEDIKVSINKSSQVALNYSVSKLLLGGAPPATTQASGPPPSTLPVNILGTIGELITAIQNKDDAGIVAAASNLKTATDQVNLAQTEYASRAIRLESAQNMLTNNQNTLKNLISNKQTLDTAKAIIQLQQQTTAYQAALQGTAKILPMSLMDYLR